MICPLTSVKGLTVQQDEIIEMARQVGIIFHGLGNTPEELEAFANLVEERTAAREREACAKVCESMPYRAASASKAAEAIRARRTNE